MNPTRCTPLVLLILGLVAALPLPAQSLSAEGFAFGVFAGLFPLAYWDWIGIAPPLYPTLWQCIGMIVGVYGVGYLVAATDPRRHWPIVLVGFLGKLFGPIGFLMSALNGTLPWSFGWINITNDLIWWIPFGLYLRDAWPHWRGCASSARCRSCAASRDPPARRRGDAR